MIRQRGKNVWQIRVEIGNDPVTGERLQSCETFRGSKRDAQAREAELKRQIRLGTFCLPSHDTLAEFLDFWLDSIRPRVAGRTIDGYRDICRNHIKPALGSLELSKIRPLHIQDFYNKAEHSGRRDGKGGLSSTTVLHIHRVLHQALKFAVTAQLIPRNPCDAIKAPRRAKKEMSVLTAAEVSELIDTCRGTDLYPPVQLACTSGLRRGEILALKWADLDFERKTLTVRRSLENSSEGLSFKEPKTDKGRRTVTLPRQTIGVLKSHRKRLLRKRLAMGDRYHDMDLVFPAENGEPWHPDTFTSAWRKVLAKTDFCIRFHDLRHTHATLLLMANVPVKVVSDRLGHSSAMLTLDTYGHVLKGMDEHAAAAMEAALGVTK